jgi:HAD superfamily hydrolase (TIGR01459 family)
MAQGRVSQSTKIPLLEGLAPLARRYDGFILDLWGVIHDGVTAFPGVIDCLDRMAEAGKSFVMLSNAPRRATAIAEGMVGMGIPAAHCRHILSSGEATWIELKTRTDPWYRAIGRTCLHIGPQRDENLFDGLDLERVPDIADAGFIMNTGPWRDEETVADYEKTLAEGARRALPMICVNPDLEVIRGGRRIICAGALALRYETLGGNVRWIGKPHLPIYGLCFEMLGVADKSRVLAIGDSLRTDIAGAEAVGIDSVLVTGGLHAEELGAASGEAPAVAAIAAACARAGHFPMAAIPHLAW